MKTSGFNDILTRSRAILWVIDRSCVPTSNLNPGIAFGGIFEQVFREPARGFPKKSTSTDLRVGLQGMIAF